MQEAVSLVLFSNFLAGSLRKTKSRFLDKAHGLISASVEPTPEGQIG